MANGSSLEKLTITAYKDEDLSEEVSTFQVLFNPQSYSLSYANEFSEPNPTGSDRPADRYSYTAPEELSISLFMDNTGVADAGSGGPGGAAINVQEYDVYLKVQEFLQATCYMNESTHEPHFLRILWGDLVFDCRLASVNVTYNLFDREGKPIRSELACTFKGSLKPSNRISKSSPDLSHLRLVKAEDNITLMTYKIYKDPVYYIRIAEANRLNNFRRLPVELALEFPPLEK